MSCGGQLPVPEASGRTSCDAPFAAETAAATALPAGRAASAEAWSRKPSKNNLHMKKRNLRTLCGVLFPAWAMVLGGVSCESLDVGGDETPDGTPYVTRVLEYAPAVGQFVNELPEYEAGDTPQTMNDKALAALGGNRQGIVTLGGFGGYIVVGFDHRIENRAGLCDFRVRGNAFYAGGHTDYGSSEPGIISVACDTNGNGIPDADEWYEIAGSSTPTASEAWLDAASAAGNDTQTVTGYEITYYRPVTEPAAPTAEYIRWEDNLGQSGYRAMNRSHLQSYYPQWVDADRLTFRGTRLPQNGLDLSGVGNNYALYAFGWGYADNRPNGEDASAIDIDWAVDASGRPVQLPGVDFIRIQTGVNQENGWLGECSTEVLGVEDLHLLGERIESRTIKP